MTTARLTPGDPAPWSIARAPDNPRYQFDTVAGRYIALCFFGSAGDPAIARMLAVFRQRGDVFDDNHASFFAIGADPADEGEKRVEEHFPGFRLVGNFGLQVAPRYGVCDEPAAAKVPHYHPTTFLLDPALRVLAVLPIVDPTAHAQQLLDLVGRLPPLGGVRQGRPAAPVLLVPQLFER